MDNVGLIGMVSIIVAGLTIAIGSIGVALGEGWAVARAMTSLAQQPDAVRDHHADVVRRRGHD